MLRFVCTPLVLITALLLSTGVLARDYMMVDEYLDAHPEQHLLSKTFSRQVSDKPSPVSKKPATAVRVAIVYPGQQISDYWRRSIRSFEARMQELDIPYQLTSVHTKPAIAVREQAQQVLNAVKANADYLIFTLDARRHRSMVEHLIAAGKPKLILQNITTPIKAWENRQPFMYVGFDHVKGSELLANWYRQRLPDAKQYALIYWARGYISEVRGDSFARFIQQDTDIKQASAFYTDATRDSAYRGALSALRQTPSLDFIYACSTDVALGVSDAIAEQGRRGLTLVNGWGGGANELQAVREGRLDVTVMRMNDDNGVAMAEAIKLDVQGQGDQVPTIYSGDFVLVSQETPETEINRLKRRAFRYSGNSP